MRIIILFKPFAFFHCFILFRHFAIIIKPKEWKMKNCRSLPHQMFIPKSYFATLEAILRFKWSVYSLLVSVIQRLMDCKEAQIWSLDGALYILLAILLNICITLNNRPQLIRLSIAYLARYKQNYVLMLHGCYTFSCSFPTTLVTLHTVAEMFLPECFFIFFFCSTWFAWQNISVGFVFQSNKTVSRIDCCWEKFMARISNLRARGESATYKF